MINFDKRGNLKPYRVNSLSLNEFADIFLKLEDIEQREILFEKYLDYVNDVVNILQTPFFQLIDGSFITQKRFPNDIDVVTFAPAERSVEVKKELYLVRDKN